MKCNKWTIGLAAVGVVSLGSVASAEESVVKAMTSGTMISGAVDTAAHWNPGTGNEDVPGYKYNSPNKADGFNLNVVELTIQKPMQEGNWAAGYRVDLLYGPDASVYNTGVGSISSASSGSSPLGSGSRGSGNFAIKQAYVNLQVPVANGINVKMGVFDSILGYEPYESWLNPNYTRSYGHTIEPQTHTGVLATYRWCDSFATSVGIADTVGPMINQRAFYARPESYKTYMASFQATAPDSWGSFAGSTLYGGVVNGYNANVLGSGMSADQTSWYVGATVKTPVTGLRAGVAYDYLGVSKQALTGGEGHGYADALAGYLSYQATEKLSLHGRAEYFWMGTDTDEFYQSVNGGYTDLPSRVVAFTGTVEYKLWENVLSRLEVRWDHQANGTYRDYGYGPSTGGRRNALLVALNVVYQF